MHKNPLEVFIMADAKRKKRIFEVDMPSINKQTNLIAYEVEELEGKYFSYDLTRLLRGKNIILFFKTKVENGNAFGVPIGLELVPSYLRKMVRKGTNYIEDSINVDGKFKIKPFLVTRRKVSRAIRKALRNKAKEEIIEFTKGKSTEEIIDEILRGSLQKHLSIKLKKIYPLSACEIKVFQAQ